MAARLSAFLVWAALAASAVFWSLKLGNTSPVAPGHTVPVGEGVVPPADLTRLFGAAPVAPVETVAPTAESSRFQLLGVVAPRGAVQPAVALIAIDSNPPRPYRVGSPVDGDMVLQRVEPRAALIGPRGAEPALRLELPPPPVAATGTLAAPPALGPAVTPRPPAPVVQPPMPAAASDPATAGSPPPPVPITAVPDQPEGEAPPQPGDDSRAPNAGPASR